MTGQGIIKHIDTLLSSSTAHDALEARLEQFADEHSITLGPNDKAAMTELAEGYIRAVANLLIECDIAATAAGIQRFVSPIIQTPRSISSAQRITSRTTKDYTVCWTTPILPAGLSFAFPRSLPPSGGFR